MVEIQRLRPDEGERFKRIRLTSLLDAPDAFGSTFEAAVTRPAESWSEQIAQHATFIAVLDGVEVGIVRGAANCGDQRAALLLGMWVMPEARGKGVGDALIDAVVGWARSEGFARLMLDVGDQNEAAIGLYTRNGFARTGEKGTLPPPRAHIGEHRFALEL